MQNKPKSGNLEETMRLWGKRTYFRILSYARLKGFPRRRINYLWRALVRVFPYVVGIAILAYILGQIVSWLGGEWAFFLSPESQAQWFVELLIIIFASVVLRFALREKEPPAPSLTLDEVTKYKLKDGCMIFGVKIRNDGDYAASDCIASLEIKGIEKSDILNGKKMSALQESPDIEINVELCWDLTPEKSKTLRSDRKGELFVARWVPRQRRKIEHFAVVADQGWDSTSMKLATTPSHYFGKVQIVPFNGKAYYVSFCLKKDKLLGPTLDLV